MGLFSFFKLGKESVEAVATPIEALGKAFDQLFTSDDERAKAQFIFEKIRQYPHILQAEINKVEAGHKSLFVAGWRPFIGWVCGFAMAWHYMGNPMAAWFCAIKFPEIVPPVLNGVGELLNLLLALLGMAGIRTWEKNNFIKKD